MIASLVLNLLWILIAAGLSCLMLFGISHLAKISHSTKVALLRHGIILPWLIGIASAVIGREAMGSSIIQLKPAPEPVWYFLLIVWLWGLAVMAQDILSGVKAARRFRYVSAPDVVQDQVDALVRRFAGTKVRLCSIEGDGAFVAGIFHPTLVLGTGVDRDKAVILHEIAHIRHRDLLWTAFAKLTSCVFWFVPFIHRVESELQLWQEVRADEFARTNSGNTDREFADRILRSAQHPTSEVGLAIGGRDMMERRIRALFCRPIGGVWNAAALLLILAVNYFAVFTAPRILQPEFRGEAVPVARMALPR